MSDHGRLFDQFSAQASHAHGGSYYDTGFGRAAVSEAHGKLFDLFGAPREQTAHGERWDNFDWRDMPAIHGQHFDSDFRAPSAGDTQHGSTWFDVFRGGRTQARYMYGGRDYEGVVQEVKREYAVVRSRDGQTHEVGLSQFLQYRTPNEQQASPAIPETESENPSTHDRTAHGAMSHDDRTPGSTEIPAPVARVTPGEHRDADHRPGVPAGLMDTFQTVKSLAEREFGDDVAKSVDATETAAQGHPTKTVGHRANCPRGGSGPCGADVDGHCTLCGAAVQDHEAVGKASTGDLGIKVPERDHKTSDHHSTQRQPETCPHCGGALEAVAEATSHGQPSRKEKEGAESEFDTVTHKCVGSAIDVLKELVA